MVMAAPSRPSNDSLLQRIRDGTARFDIDPPINTPSRTTPNSAESFARIGPPLGGGAMRKVEHFSVHRITGDGRCMFRALVSGMATNKGITLNSREETADADELRMAVKETICDSGEERHQYEEALIAITVEESLKRYCQRIERSDFWGGESELLVLSKLCKQPVIVYIPEHEHARGSWGHGVIPIAEYGAEFGKNKKGGKLRKPVRLLFSGKNHYDLLI